MAPGHDDLSHIHRPVLVAETLGLLAAPDHPPRLVVDGTVGLGGHAEAMLAAWPAARLLGLDRDPDALAMAKQRLRRFQPRARFFHASYADLEEVLDVAKERNPDAVLLDLGVSSLQLDEPSRGFSFRADDATADMRFDPSSGGPTAADLVNRLPEEAIARILFEHGDERRARAVAKALVEARPLRTVGQMTRAIRRVVRRDASGLDPATRTFQALRVAVNDERGHLVRGLGAALRLAAPGARIVVIAFHSGEERVVKEAFAAAEAAGTGRVLTEKPVRPTDDETRGNPRARPARLRAIERLEPATAGAAGAAGGRARAAGARAAKGGGRRT
jgi:16S rRNA (cytosine1402-N4)-methyltransferase